MSLVRLLRSVPDGPDVKQWGSSAEFIIASLGFAVGLGNVWRFPNLVFSNGGGAFLLIYVLCLFLIAIPLVLMETGIGQFTSRGPVGMWSVAPILQGVGVATTIQSYIMSIYYNAPIAWGAYYFVESIKSCIAGELTWLSCDYDWLEPHMHCAKTLNEAQNLTLQYGAENVTRSSHEFFYNGVLRISDLTNFGTLNWYLVGYSFIVCLLIFVIVSLGQESIGKIAYFTSLFPYVVLTAMFVFGLTLPGSGEGLEYLFKPNMTKLGNYNIWTDALGQAFFSTGVGEGGIVTLAAYNSFRNNIVRDSMLIPVLDCLTSIFAGCCVFAILGNMKYLSGADSIADVTDDGPGLFFVVYPEAFGQMPGGQYWAVAFFFMVVILGLSSNFPPLETISKMLEDHVDFIGRQSKTVKILVRGLLCFGCWALGIIFYCQAGYHLHDLMDNRIVIYPLMVIAATEAVYFGWFYGANRLARDIALMVDWRQWFSPFWQISWRITVPVVVGVLLFMELLNIETYKGFPDWTIAFTVVMVLLPLMPIFVVFFLRIGGCARGVKESLKIDSSARGWYKALTKPGDSWGPDDDTRRHYYRQMVDPLWNECVIHGGDPSDDEFDEVDGVDAAKKKPAGVVSVDMTLTEKKRRSSAAGVANSGYIGSTGTLDSPAPVQQLELALEMSDDEEEF